MNGLMRNNIKAVLILLFLLLLSCVTTLSGRQYIQGSVIDIGDYSIIGPPGDGWFVNIQKSRRTVEFKKSNGSKNESFMVRVFRNWITDEKLKRLSEKEVADDFREKEEVGMLMMGVMRGKYMLTDVKKDTTRAKGPLTKSGLLILCFICSSLPILRKIIFSTAFS